MAQLSYDPEFRLSDFNSVRGTQKKKKQSELSKITSIEQRIKLLDWNKNSTISKACAERRFELSEYTNSQQRPKKSRKKKRTELGLWHCVICGEVYEIAEQYGSRRSTLEVHYYNGLIPTRNKDKKECPKCTGTLSDYRVVGLH